MNAAHSRHATVALVGQVGGGKSALAGRLGRLSPHDKRKRDAAARAAVARDAERRGFAFAWSVSTREERERGVTTDAGRFELRLPSLTATVVDLPGHRDFVKNMITGVSCADAALLVVSASEGELEAGLCEDGQTREHAVLAAAFGVKQIVVCVNKMDHSSVCWSQARFEEVQTVVGKLLRKLRFPPDRVSFVPVSAFLGDNLTVAATSPARQLQEKSVSGWYSGPSLIDLIDAIDPQPGSVALESKPLRVAVFNAFRISGIGTVVAGNVLSGTLRAGVTVAALSPSALQGRVFSVEMHNVSIDCAVPGDVVGFNVSNVCTRQVDVGMVVGDAQRTPPLGVRSFVARIVVLECFRGEIGEGFEPVVHAHTARVACVLSRIIAKTRKKNCDPVDISNEYDRVLHGGNSALVEFTPMKPVVVEPFKECAALGRFVVRASGRTIAFGVVERVEEAPLGVFLPPERSRKKNSRALRRERKAVASIACILVGLYRDPNSALKKSLVKSWFYDRNVLGIVTDFVLPGRHFFDIHARNPRSYPSDA